MTGLKNEDRTRIRDFHGVSHGSMGDGSSRTGSSRKRSSEDASDSNELWQKEPTRIQQPGLYKSASGLTPYAKGRLVGNLNGIRGNHVAKSVITNDNLPFSRPNKRARIDDKSRFVAKSGISSKHFVSNGTESRGQDEQSSGHIGMRHLSPALDETERVASGSNIGNSRPAKGKDKDTTVPDNTINIVDEEDVGYGLIWATDYEPASDYLGAEAKMNTISSGRPKSQARSIAQDGDGTLRLRHRIIHARSNHTPTSTAIDVDELNPPRPQPSENKRATSPGGQTKFLFGNVQSKKAAYDAVPRMDLREQQNRKSGLVKGMKGKEKAHQLRIQPVKETIGNGALNHSKQSMKGNQLDPIATSSTPFGPVDLPLEAWIYGAQVFSCEPEEITPKYWLRWDVQTQELLAQTHPPKTDNSQVIFTISISGISKMQYTAPSVQEPIVGVLQENLKLVKVSKKSPSIRLSHGPVTFKFRTGHASWQSHQYDAIVRSLKAQNPVIEILNEHSSHKYWEMAVNNAAAESSVYSQRTRQHVIDESRLKFGNALLLMSPKVSSTGAKTKPRPIPAYKRVDKGAESLSASSPPTTLRRSVRQITAAEPSPRAPSPNSEEIILVYPSSGPGAVNICQSDLKRLRPGEYLNDTLIELGLKFWMNDLRANRPELADQIHVFNSFFYKKLNSNVKKVEEGYRSLRKWTAKVDIFKKKYIIVPINEHIHWYLAIIYHPEHVLEPPSPELPRITNTPLTRGRKRASTDHHAHLPAERRRSLLSPREGPRPTSPSTGEISDHLSGTMADEDAVEEQLIQSTQSCSLVDDDNVKLGRVEGGGPRRREDIVVPDSDEEISSSTPIQPQSEPQDKHISATSCEAKEDAGMEDNDQKDQSNDNDDDDLGYPDSIGHDHGEESLQNEQAYMDVDSPSPTSANATSPHSASCGSSRNTSMTCSEGTDVCDMLGYTPEQPHGTALTSNAIPAKRFYGSDQKRTEKPVKTQPIPMGLQEGGKDDDDNLNAPSDSGMVEKRTYIFTLDSLGATHKSVHTRLSSYLRMEAKDKKGLEDTSMAVGKNAQVPVQPNYCDCGLYLLHFAKTFMSDPEGYCKTICTSTKNTASDIRYKAWKGGRVSNMREDMMQRILDEAGEWKKEKARKESEKKDTGDAVGMEGTKEVAEDSDDDMIIIEDVGASKPQASKRVGSSRKEKVTVMGKAARLR